MTTITLKKSGVTTQSTCESHQAALPKKSGKPATKTQSPRQWENLVGKRYELILKVGHIIRADVIGIYAHTLTVTNMQLERRDSDVVESYPQSAHIDCQNIAIAIEEVQS